MDSYCNQTLYQTRDNVIPFRLFFLLELASNATFAQERLTQSNAIVLGISMAMDGNNPKVTEIRREWEKLSLGKLS